MKDNAKALLSALVWCLISPALAPAFAQSGAPDLLRLQSLPADMRTISTFGTSEVLVVPNKITVLLGVKNFDHSLQTACAANDQAAKHLIELAEKYKIDPTDVQTGEIVINPIYPQGQSQYGTSYGTEPVAKPVGFSSQIQISFILRKGQSPSALIADGLSSGANSVASISRETSDLRKYRDQARLEALRAAREKAASLAGECGMKAGKPLHIQEGNASEGPGYFARTSNASMSSADASEGGGETFALGVIPVKSTVSVTWQLVD